MKSRGEGDRLRIDRLRREAIRRQGFGRGIGKSKEEVVEQKCPDEFFGPIETDAPKEEDDEKRRMEEFFFGPRVKPDKPVKDESVEDSEFLKQLREI